MTGSTGFVPGFTQVLTPNGYRYLGEDRKPYQPPHTVVLFDYSKKETL